MKNHSLRQPTAFPIAALVQALAGILVLSLHAGARAQELPPLEDAAVGVEAPVAPPPRVWVVPRVSIAQRFSDNSQLSTQNRQGEQATEVSPGIGMVLNTARLRGFLDYSLRGTYDAQNTVRDTFQQSLNANGTFVAWDNRAFIDLSGVIGQQAISAFESPSVDSVGNRNLSETSSFRVSPYLRGTLLGTVDYELRHTLQNTKTDTVTRSDLHSEETLARFGREAIGQAFGWTLEASTGELRYDIGARSKIDSVNGRLAYAVNPTLVMAVLAGVDSNNLLTPDMESYNSKGLSLEWRPSDRTRVYLERSSRYFGNGHNVEVEYRSRRSVWRFTDTRDAVTGQLDASGASLGSLYGLIDNFIGDQVTDPVQRAILVDAELQRLGLPANLEVFPGYLTSAATVQRIQELSLGLFGQRNAVVLAVSRNNTRPLAPALISLGDDFGFTQAIVQKVWTASFAHRLTPLTSFTALYSRQANEGVNTTLKNNLRSLTLGMTTRLGYRTSGVLQFRHSVYDGSTPYRENAVLGVLTHRF